ncbi:MAG: peroxiredoxin [Paeniglutamicibacter terrestris]
MNSDLEMTTRQLTGSTFPDLVFGATDGTRFTAREFSTRSFILFIYPKTGRPDVAEAAPWSMIPGVKGCTPESCEFRDLASDFAAIGYSILGLSGQHTEYQQEAAERLHLGYSLLSDPEFTLASALGLPTFEFDSERLYVRGTLVVSAGIITHVQLGITDAAGHPRHLLEQLRNLLVSEHHNDSDDAQSKHHEGHGSDRHSVGMNTFIAHAR